MSKNITTEEEISTLKTEIKQLKRSSFAEKYHDKFIKDMDEQKEFIITTDGTELKSEAKDGA